MDPKLNVANMFQGTLIFNGEVVFTLSHLDAVIGSGDRPDFATFAEAIDAYKIEQNELAKNQQPADLYCRYCKVIILGVLPCILDRISFEQFVDYVETWDISGKKLAGSESFVPEFLLPSATYTDRLPCQFVYAESSALYFLANFTPDSPHVSKYQNKITRLPPATRKNKHWKDVSFAQFAAPLFKASPYYLSVDLAPPVLAPEKPKEEVQEIVIKIVPEVFVEKEVAPVVETGQLFDQDGKPFNQDAQLLWTHIASKVQSYDWVNLTMSAGCREKNREGFKQIIKDGSLIAALSQIDTHHLYDVDSFYGADPLKNLPLASKLFPAVTKVMASNSQPTGCCFVFSPGNTNSHVFVFISKMNAAFNEWHSDSPPASFAYPQPNLKLRQFKDPIHLSYYTLQRYPGFFPEAAIHFEATLASLITGHLPNPGLIFANLNSVNRSLHCLENVKYSKNTFSYRKLVAKPRGTLADTSLTSLAITKLPTELTSVQHYYFSSLSNGAFPLMFFSIQEFRNVEQWFRKQESQLKAALTPTFKTVLSAYQYLNTYKENRPKKYDILFKALCDPNFIFSICKKVTSLYKTVLKDMLGQIGVVKAQGYRFSFLSDFWWSYRIYFRRLYGRASYVCSNSLLYVPLDSTLTTTSNSNLCLSPAVNNTSKTGLDYTCERVVSVLSFNKPSSKCVALDFRGCWVRSDDNSYSEDPTEDITPLLRQLDVDTDNVTLPVPFGKVEHFLFYIYKNKSHSVLGVTFAPPPLFYSALVSLGPYDPKCTEEDLLRNVQMCYLHVYTKLAWYANGFTRSFSMIDFVDLQERNLDVVMPEIHQQIITYMNLQRELNPREFFVKVETKMVAKVTQNANYLQKDDPGEIAALTPIAGSDFFTMY